MSRITFLLLWVLLPSVQIISAVGPLAAQDPLLSSSDTATGLPQPSCSVCGSCSETFPEPFVPTEWVEPVKDLVLPVSGTVTTSDISGNDVPFSHPFGNDFEGWIMPDNIPGYILDASSLGLLRMEMEQGLIAPVFRPQKGDRVVMHGRWIVDCGHKPYQTEVHPPFLIASAHVSPYTGGSVATFVALPYITNQLYYPSKLPLVQALVDQLELGDVLPLQAYPYIAANPFPGPFTATYRVRLQTRTGDPNPKLYYHFTTRPGVTVQVTVPPEDSVHALLKISVDPSQYVAPPPPDCTTKQLSLNDADKLAGWPDGSIEGIAIGAAGSLWILGHPEKLFLGVMEKQCSLGYAQGLVSLPPADNKIFTDDSQTFPVYGWIATDASPWTNACPKSSLEECKQQYQDCMSSRQGKGGPTPPECAQQLLQCPKNCPLPAAQLAQLTLSLNVVPKSNAGRFTVQVDKVNTALSQVQQQAAAGPAIVTPGPHVVSVLSGISTSLDQYKISFTGDCDAQGNVTVQLGQSKSCTVTATALVAPKPPAPTPAESQCLRACTATYQDCLSSPRGSGNPTPQQCSAALQACKAACK